MTSAFRPDPVTLMLAASLITPLIAAANYFLWRQTREHALLWWAGGAVAMAAGTLVELGASDRPAITMLGGIALVLSHWLFYRGIRVFYGATAIGLRSVDGVLILLLLTTYPVAILAEHPILGHGPLSLIIALIASACAYWLVVRHGGQARGSSYFAGAIFVFNALLYGACGTAALVVREDAVTWPELHAAGFVLLVGWSFGFLMLIGQRNQERLARLANHDELTGANTRRALLEKGRHLFAMASRHGPPLGVMMLDIDLFKKINDTYGHAAGDLVLKNFAHIVRQYMRASDVFGRLGGEEFCILLPDTGPDGVTNAAERICSSFAASSVVCQGISVSATVSIGVAVYVPEIASLDALIARADEALYQAKHLGRDRVCCASGDEYSAPVVRLVWDARFRSGNEAIDREHEYLFSWANALLGKMQKNAGNHAIEADIRELLHWLTAHFRHEEEILARLGWEGLPRHAKQHRDLEDRGAVLLAEFQSGQRNFAELLDFVVLEIIGRHLARHDAQYFPLTKAA